MHSLSRYISCSLIFFLPLVSSGCADKTTVVLLPDPSGKVGKVTVTSDGGTAEIDEALESTTISSRTASPSKPRILSQKTIDREFGQTLAFLPEQPEHFLLYFKMDSTQLTTSSMQTIDKILTTIKEKESVDISVVGHTDTAGNRDYNFRLSRQRATAVAELLGEKGVKKRLIKTTSHGENNPLIPTKDNVIEPKNRRVEVTVR